METPRLSIQDVFAWTEPSAWKRDADDVMDNKELSKKLSGLRRQGEWSEALRVLESSRRKIQFDTISYTAAISACERDVQWRCSLDLIRDMRQRWTEADVAVYNAAMNIRGKGSQ